MAVIFLAEALRIVLIINNSSINVSLTGGEVGCMMYTSLPRTFSFTMTLTSPSGKWDTVILPRGMPKWFAMSVARGLLLFPVKSFMPPNLDESRFQASLDWFRASSAFWSTTITTGDEDAVAFSSQLAVELVVVVLLLAMVLATAMPKRAAGSHWCAPLPRDDPSLPYKVKSVNVSDVNLFVAWRTATPRAKEIQRPKAQSYLRSHSGR